MADAVVAGGWEWPSPDRLRNARKAAGMSLHEVQAWTSIESWTLEAWEAGRRSGRLEDCEWVLALLEDRAREREQQSAVEAPSIETWLMINAGSNLPSVDVDMPEDVIVRFGDHMKVSVVGDGQANADWLRRAADLFADAADRCAHQALTQAAGAQYSWLEPQREAATAVEVDDLVTTEEFAELVRVPVSTVYYWRSIRKGPRGVKVGKRVLYRRAEITTWYEQLRQERP